MAATVMTAELGSISDSSSLGIYSEACKYSSIWQTLKLIGNHVDCDILIWNNHVLNSNMYTNNLISTCGFYSWKENAKIFSNAPLAHF